MLCYPLTFETNDFYMSSDMTLLLDNIRVRQTKIEFKIIRNIIDFRVILNL